jgi:adenylate cyclase
LLRFESALDALLFAGELQRRIIAKNEKRLQLRIGIHVGDVVERGGDVLGDTVNIASRLVGASSPSGICISQQTYDQVKSKLPYRIDEVGEATLKHLKGPIKLYKVIIGEIERRRLGEHENKSIAVLPLHNLSNDLRDVYFADGITEEVITTSANLPGLGVIARGSVMKYREEMKRISEIASELDVDVVLEGSVRKSGNKVRITSQLIDGKTEELLWSGIYDAEMTDLFALQAEIAGKIAHSLRLKVLEKPCPSASRKTETPEAFTYYLKGRFFWNKKTEPDLLKSIEYYKKAIKEDPNYAQSYCGLADSYASLALFEFLPPTEAFPEAKDVALKALKIDNRLAEAHSSLGLVRFQGEWDWNAAKEEFRKALSLNLNYPAAHHWYADMLKALGRFEKALNQITIAQKLDPLSLSINTGVGHVLYLSRRYDEAIEQYKKTVELDPNFLQARLWFSRPYLELGLYEEAIKELKEAVKLSNKSTISLAILGHAYASSGDLRKAEEILEQSFERSRH